MTITNLFIIFEPSNAYYLLQSLKLSNSEYIIKFQLCDPGTLILKKKRKKRLTWCTKTKNYGCYVKYTLYTYLSTTLNLKTKLI